MTVNPSATAAVEPDMLRPPSSRAPSLTDFTEIRLSRIHGSVSSLCSVLAARCSPRSRIYCAGELRASAARLRTEAAYLEDSARELEGCNHG